jgi:hypothetical protein
LLIVSNFGSKAKSIKVNLPNLLMLDAEKTYRAKDLLWNEMEIVIEKGMATVELPPYGSYIFKIQE